MGAAKSVDGENLLNDVVVYLFFFLELIRNGHDFSYLFDLASYVLEIDPTTEPKN